MEVITGATLFATFVSLITQYKSEVTSRKTKDVNDFKDWLNENRYTDVVDLLCRDSATLNEIESMIRQDNDVFIKKLNAIESALVAYASSVQGFSNIALAVHPRKGLSEQALSILTQMEEIGAEALLKSAGYGGVHLGVIRGPHGEINLAEPRYLDSDLDQLVNLGLLLIQYNNKGQPVYVITREASKLVRDHSEDS